MEHRPSLKSLLKDSLEPLIADGSFATSLYEKGFYINRSFEELSVIDAQAVREVSQSFKRAGAQLLHTNTFGATLPKLTEYGLQDQHEQILSSAVRLTKDVASSEAYVLGSIGPLGVVLEPLGPTSFEEAYDFFSQNVKVLSAACVDGLSLLGFHDLTEMRAALEAVRSQCELPVFAHIAVQENMKTSYGHSLKEFVDMCEEFDVEVLGLSGEVGPSGALTALEKLRDLTQRPLSLLPNAGLPRYVNDQYVYLCNPDYIGKYAKRFVQAGARVVGGHSGVFEAHIKAVANAVRMAGRASVEVARKSSPDQNSNSTFRASLPASIQIAVDEPKAVAPQGERSQLGEAFSRGQRVISVEIVPPQGVDCSRFFDHCRSLQEAGVQFVNIPDGARAVARMSSLQLASYIQKNFEIEPIPHFTTRDRNLIGLQSDLLGSYVNGIRNVLVVTGDPPKLGNCPGATAVYDVDAIGLTHILSRMNQGLDLGGSSFGRPTEFMVGVALNPTASNQELEMKRFHYKVDAGADYAITQPIYSLEAYKRFMDQLGEVDIPIVMGIWPLVSLRNAEFLRNEVPGVEVPQWAVDEMKRAKGDKEEMLKRGKEIAVKTIEEAKGLVSGFQVSAPFNRVEVALEVIEAAHAL